MPDESAQPKGPQKIPEASVDRSAGSDGRDAADEAEATRLDMLIEKSLRGALTDDEQRELGAMLSASAEVAAQAHQAQKEDRSMQELIKAATERFDPEVARRAIEHELLTWRRAWRMLPIMAILMIVMTSVFTAARSGWTTVDWSVVLGLTAFCMLCWSATWFWFGQRARRISRAASFGGDALESSYRKQVASIPKHILAYRILAIAVVLLFGWELFRSVVAGSDQIFWLIAFFLMLPNLYFAFDRRTIDRISGSMSGVIDPKTPTAPTSRPNRRDDETSAD